MPELALALIHKSQFPLEDWSGFELYHFYPETGLLWPLVLRGTSARVLGQLGDCISAYSKKILDTYGRLDGGECLVKTLLKSIDPHFQNDALDAALTAAIQRVQHALCH